MIFNINSTRGQTRFLTCLARVTCLVYLKHQVSCIWVVTMSHKISIKSEYFNNFFKLIGSFRVSALCDLKNTVSRFIMYYFLWWSVHVCWFIDLFICTGIGLDVVNQFVLSQTFYNYLALQIKSIVQHHTCIFPCPQAILNIPVCQLFIL